MICLLGITSKLVQYEHIPQRFIILGVTMNIHPTVRNVCRHLTLIFAAFVLPACTCDRSNHQTNHLNHEASVATGGPSSSTQESQLRFGQPYRYDPEGRFRKDNYKITRTIIFNSDGTGHFSEAMTGKFRWHFTPATNGGEINITEWYEVKDGEGTSVDPEVLSKEKVIMHVLRTGERIHESGTDRIYEVVK